MLQAKLREQITQRGFKQKYLADQLGVSKQTLSAWVTGKINPPLESAFKLSRLLGCTVEDLWNYVEELREEGNTYKQ